jgi:hypothetical protein
MSSRAAGYAAWVEFRELELELELRGKLRERGSGGYDLFALLQSIGERRVQVRPCRNGSLDPRYVRSTLPTVLECPRCTVTLAMATTLRLLQQIVTLSCCTIYLEDFRFSVFGGDFEVVLYAKKV